MLKLDSYCPVYCSWDQSFTNLDLTFCYVYSVIGDNWTSTAAVLVNLSFYLLGIIPLLKRMKHCDIFKILTLQKFASPTYREIQWQILQWLVHSVFLNVHGWTPNPAAAMETAPFFLCMERMFMFSLVLVFSWFHRLNVGQLLSSLTK